MKIARYSLKPMSCYFYLYMDFILNKYSNPYKILTNVIYTLIKRIERMLKNELYYRN